jgi:hypothetical protein
MFECYARNCGTVGKKGIKKDRKGQRKRGGEKSGKRQTEGRLKERKTAM